MNSKLYNMVRATASKRISHLDYNIWIFSSVDNDNFNYNSRYLFLYVKECITGITPLYVINDGRKRKSLSEQYGERYFISSLCKEGLRQILGSGVWFTSAGLPAYSWKAEPERIVVNLWHGVPLKKIVMMENHMNKLKKLYFKKLFLEKYTWILTTSSHLIPIMAESFAVSKEIIKVWGQPRNDGLFSACSKEEFLDIIEVEHECRKLILYAPTFREGQETRLFPFGDYDPETLEAFLQERSWYICIRSHLECENKTSGLVSTHIRMIDSDVIEDITGWMSCFDLLITDYSSIYVDYLLLEKPIIFLPYDKVEYIRSRGMNFCYEEVTPGPKPDTLKWLIKELDCLLNEEDPYKEQRKKCNRFFNQVQEPCMGHICNCVLDEIAVRQKENRYEYF